MYSYKEKAQKTRPHPAQAVAQALRNLGLETFDSHDQSMEVTKDFGKTAPVCWSRSIKTTPTNTVMLNRESKHNRGLLRTNSQIQVANRLGDVVGSATHTVGNGAKDA